MSLTLFKYADPTPGVNTLYLVDAQAITGFTSLMWIERYRNAGEFTITAPVSSGLRTKLPLGSLISHTDTQELMIVESHEISDNIDGDVNIVITGRSFETFMEQRVLTYNSYSGNGGNPPASDLALENYILTGSNKAAAHIVELIEWNLYSGIGTSTNIDNCRTVSTVPTSVGEAAERQLAITDLYKAVIDLLAIDDLGIRSVRPGPLSGLPLATDLGFIIHQGEDKTASVSFDHASGDIRSGQYLWTLKTKKNAVLAQGANYRTIKNPTNAVGYELRAGYLAATDISTDPPNSASEIALLSPRADAYLGSHKETNISRVEITPTTNKLRYRQDYMVGDIVAVSGNYNTSASMRVVEHVEIIDANGQSSYPTLEAI